MSDKRGGPKDGWSADVYRKVVGRLVLTVKRHETYLAWDWSVTPIGDPMEGPAGANGREKDPGEAMKMAEHFAARIGGVADGLEKTRA